MTEYASSSIEKISQELSPSLGIEDLQATVTCYAVISFALALRYNSTQFIVQAFKDRLTKLMMLVQVGNEEGNPRRLLILLPT